MKWKNAQTHQPGDQIVLIHSPDATQPVWLGYWHDGKWYEYDADVSPICVTHWMELPEPPPVG
ncbi:MAG: DUF551 domain-containing protein [bacterium]|nr:DUF551 domain-containing protein [bacterium]